ncbi:MAG TPA: phosphatidate cytidylyltransferase [Myxococcota bacterium]|nr:phosphatidate cytidylyltransferase [Myxococcota bacterium]
MQTPPAMLTRILTGVLLAPLVVLLFLWGPEWARALVLITAAGLCLGELFAMAMPDRPLERWLGIALGVAVLVSMWRVPEGFDGDLLAMLVLPALLVVARPDPIDKAAHRLFALWAGFIYIVIPFHYGVKLGIDQDPWILYALGVVWSGDTGAYFAGRFLGRHKLHPRVSPKKTIEGAIGGIAASIGGGLLMVSVLGLPMPTGYVVAYSAIGGALGQLGDLAESLLKRTFGVKDSGAILPGHGGMLDRLDGVIFAFPFFGLVLGLGF